MSQNGCRFLRLGALLCLIPLALYFLGSNGGGMQTLDLPSHGNTSIDTPLSGWTPRGPSSVWLTDEKRLLETLRPGDNVRIYCRTIGMFAGDEASLLV